MIKLSNVSKGFKEKYILSNFSLTVEKGEFVSIVGKSGSGKTTLLNLIGLIEKPDKGHIEIEGENILNPKSIMNLRRYTFGYIFQNYALLNDQSVKDNLTISQAYSKKTNDDLYISALEQVGLDKSYLFKRIYELSGGEQQRIAIARIIIKPCDIILADEPTGNLDDFNKNIVLSLFKKLQKNGKTIICVTHDNEIAQQSDRIITL
jgi:putative ABC transport system ATP-binding protein